MHMTHPEQAVFVTEDKNFRKESRMRALRKCHFPGEILPAEEAVTFIVRVLGVRLPV
jgi:hypothetical protein